ncbi:MAG: hypothetical protein HN948_02370 [Clostridia bacterium]|jgi:predicted small secreted protein|nr:hypothetical protein [Clostridia bacterium]MBT7121836.1 hypothetical protein [Clostridia bacterium]
MKKAQKVSLLIAALLLISVVLIGCNTIPGKYTDGVKLTRDYPEDDMPLADDALVFYCDKDDSQITVEYGTQDDLDDIADMYKDFFEDNAIIPTNETDKSSKYAAEGDYKDFHWQINASNPSGEYEEQLFITVVKVEIEFSEQVAVTDTRTASEKLVGFWRQETFDGDAGLVSVMEVGAAIDFLADGSVYRYEYFSFYSLSSWSVLDEDTVQIVKSDGSSREANYYFEVRDGVDYLVWEEKEATMIFFKDTFEDFRIYDEQTLADDDNLYNAIADTAWYYIHYNNEVGEITSSSTGLSIYHKDGTFEDTFDRVTFGGQWFVQYGIMTCDYDDGTYQDFNIGLDSRFGINYLYVYSVETSEYWLYADHPGGITMTDRTWYAVSYVPKNGDSELFAEEETHEYSSDSSYQYVYADGSSLNGTWDIVEDEIHLHYDDSTTSFATFDVKTSKGINYLRIDDMSEGNEGAYWVYSSPSFFQEIVTYTSDEDMTNAVAENEWFSMAYMNADESLEEAQECYLKLRFDGTFVEIYKGEEETGTYYFENEHIFMLYYNGDEYSYPVYIEYHLSDDVLLLYLGDNIEGNEGCYFVFTESAE